MYKHYGERDIEDLDEAGNFYLKHVMAMTSESLHRKSDIAAELGFRDMQIYALEQELAALKEQVRWRSVEDELPSDGQFIVFRPSAGFDPVAIRTYRRDDFSGSINVTHWMPLPTHPTT